MERGVCRLAKSNAGSGEKSCPAAPESTRNPPTITLRIRGTYPSIDDKNLSTVLVILLPLRNTPPNWTMTNNKSPDNINTARLSA